MYQRDFSLNDFARDLLRMRSMGSMKDLMKMVPGLSAQVDDLNIDESEITRSVAIIRAMTPGERRDAETIDASRCQRVARGSGTRPEAVSGVIRSYYLIRDMWQQMHGTRGRF